MKYRPDIDGLRAISILLVTVFHFNLLSLGKGGFIGVDIFFVISGFLITNIIVSDLEAGRFSLGHFYARRVKRLYPALLATLLLYLLAGYFLFLPPHFRELGMEALLSQLYVVNFYFWQTVTYFGLRAGDVPLLHMWSLAVEEQFYLFYPLLSLLIYRWRKHWLAPAIVITAVLSFLLGLVATSLTPGAAFYLLPTRAWELLAGGILALVLRRDPALGRLGGWSGLAGLGLIVVALYLHTPATGVPGWFALLPVGAAVLLIAGGGNVHAPATRLLSLPVMVWIGKISYPLYLVHWPVMQLLKELTPEFTLPVRAFGFVLSFLVAWGIYAIVERPIRTGKILVRQSHVLAGTAAISAALVGFSILVVMQAGLPSRFSQGVNAILAHAEDGAVKFRNCQGRLSAGAAPCRLGAPDATPTLLMFGDSHANALAHAFDIWLSRTGQAGYFSFESGCLPVFAMGGAQCRAQVDAAMRLVADHPEVETVALVSIWRQPYEGGMLHEGKWTADSPRVFVGELAHTVAAFRAAGKQVVLLDPLYAAPRSVPETLAKNLAFSRTWPVDTHLADHRAVFDRLFATFDGVTAEGARRISLVDQLCRDGICPGMIDGKPVFSDNNHLADWMSADMSVLIEQAFADMNGKDIR